jgi:Alpha amylase, catalytic domain
LGAKVILLSSIFKSKSPFEGYDTVDFKAINSVLGSMEDFEALVKAADAKGMLNCSFAFHLIILIELDCYRIENYIGLGTQSFQ